MRCPRCDGIEDKVLESRSLASGESLRRRRECLSCGYRFTSYERIEEKRLMVIKNDKRREVFEREKLERGIQRACEKRNISQVTIEEMINDIEDEAAMIGKSVHEITSRKVGEIVLKKLYALDRVAYVRFASVYRQFKDVDEFVREIASLKGGD
ncbi:MAG: transcriptional regulator NrdR [Spirochaetales bacterium]|jgi:transcriptional repressor NrdR|nr:transcriptional regulator NrdR [Spirochaetales bacterium]